ncbi:MAG: hypothetical protein V4449_02545 [Patescibacteria group bacterium]
MTQRNILIGVVVIALIALGVWYFSSKNTAPLETDTDVTVDTSTTGTDTTATPGTVPVKGTGALKTAFAQGGNYTCTLNALADDNGKTTGTVYASAGKTRTDFRAQAADGVVTELHIIRDGAFAYTWVSGQVTGTKTAITANSAFVPRQPSGAGIVITDESSVNWDCHPWLTDKSQFVPPVSITFIAG